MKRFLILALVGTSLFAYSQTMDHPVGEIKGTVTDMNGTPVSAASVYAVAQDNAFDGITPRSVKTDANGEFDFRGGFRLGAYKLYSRKDVDAYPDRSDSFYADSKTAAPKVDLTEDSSSATVNVTLGEKAGVLAGRVIDADTGAALKAKLVFLDEDGNDHSVFVDGKYRALLPAGKDVTLIVMVMSPDYRSQVPSAPLRLEPGQEMLMDIPLSKQ
jgi:Carboxypeptidase regulatory-like domain